MPTYEYQCNRCNHQMEVFQSITADPLKMCPSCGKEELKRLISAGAGIVFKGSGFYETDYKRSAGYKKLMSEEKQQAKPPEPKKDAKSDSSPTNKTVSGAGS